MRGAESWRSLPLVLCLSKISAGGSASGSVILMLSLLVASSESFLMTRVEPGQQATVKPGDSISLLCEVTAHIF